MVLNHNENNQRPLVTQVTWHMTWTWHNAHLITCLTSTNCLNLIRALSAPMTPTSWPRIRRKGSQKRSTSPCFAACTMSTSESSGATVVPQYTQSTAHGGAPQGTRLTHITSCYDAWQVPSYAHGMMYLSAIGTFIAGTNTDKSRTEKCFFAESYK